MTLKTSILVLAGSREAHHLVAALAGRGRRVIASLPEPERMFEALPVPTRTGRFDGPSDFAAWIRRECVATVIDASHPFDTAASDLAADVCRHLSLRYLRILRPPWEPSAGDTWQPVAHVSAAVDKLPEHARVFTNTGWPSLPDYAHFSGEKLFMRQTADVTKPAPYPFVEFVPGQPPFSQFQEQELFETLRITHLICRNTGGAASMSKLLAARALKLPVYMVDRAVPALQPPTVETVAEALAWEAA